MERLRIAVADDEQQMRSYYDRTLTAMGHEVIAVCDDGCSLIRACQANRPDLIISDVCMPNLDGIEAVLEICRDEPLPVILVSAHNDDELLRRAALESILAYLIKPIKRADLQTAIAIVLQRFRQFQSLHRRADDLRQTLEDRKIIERAKGVLMTRAMLNEPVAFRRLQKLASEKNLKLVELARQIVTADEALR